ncbi:MAG: hypothetical protein AAF571_11385 [Verrucomicrobiota bacterium]
MKRRVFFTILLLLGLVSMPAAIAQMNPTKDSSGVIDLSDVTDAYVRNMKLLKIRMTGEDELLLEQMDAVIAQAEDLGSFFRAKGTASKRRQLVEQREELKFKKDLSKNDMRKLNELQQEIKELDPENFFGKARGLYNETQGELLGQLDLIQTSDPVRKDIIRLIRQHLANYSKALKEY